MATPAHQAHSTRPPDSSAVRTITYRGPTVLLGAFAHLLREAGLEFERPSDDRRVTDAAVEAVLSVDAADPAVAGTLDAMIEAAVTKFTTRFGDDSATIRVGDDASPADRGV
jgi:hypothetical protein